MNAPSIPSPFARLHELYARTQTSAFLPGEVFAEIGVELLAIFGTHLRSPAAMFGLLAELFRGTGFLFNPRTLGKSILEGAEERDEWERVRAQKEELLTLLTQTAGMPPDFLDKAAARTSKAVLDLIEEVAGKAKLLPFEALTLLASTSILTGALVRLQAIGLEPSEIEGVLKLAAILSRDSNVGALRDAYQEITVPKPSHGDA